MMQRFALLLTCLLAISASAQEDEARPKVLAKKHDTHNRGHEAIEQELRTQEEEDEDVESFTCTLTGASGQDTCDAAKDDDGSKCVWCVLNNFGFCVSGEQAATFEQAIPTIDCDDKPDNTDDDKPPPPDDDTFFNCLESKDEASCGDSCTWCNTKGGFGVCLTKESAAEASDSYWFDCPSLEEEEEEDAPSISDRYYGREDGEEEEMEDWEEGESDSDEEEEDYDYEDYYGQEEDDDMHEFMVDTTCVLSGMLLDPADEEATSENACFQARDGAGNPCEWCAVAGSPFRLCLSEPQAQVAEYVGAVCTGSDESFEPEDFDDSCIAHQANDHDLSKDGCWQHKDLDGNGCEWCNVMGVELCLGGVQAELVEHWGATCVMDNEEHEMAEKAIRQHLAWAESQRDAERVQKQAEKIAQRGEGKPEQPIEEEDEEDDIDLATLWLTSDPSCMVTTLRTSIGDDDELACAQAKDGEDNPCNWCQMGTSFYMCMNDEQADVAEYMGMECETISTETQDILDDHGKRVEDYEDEDYEEEDGPMDDAQDFDPSCIMAMQNGPDQTGCVNTKDQDGQACEWCSWNQFSLCLASEQAEMIEPFGVTCDQVQTAVRSNEKLPESALLKELTTQMDTSCLLEAGKDNDGDKCIEGKDASGKPCEWCSLGSLGVKACFTAEQAQLGRPMGVACQPEEFVKAELEGAILHNKPNDFYSCLSMSQSVDDCDYSCTWCDLKGSPTGAGLCLSDAIADAVVQNWGVDILDCTEEVVVRGTGQEEEAQEEEESDDEEGEEEEEEEEEEAEEKLEQEEEAVEGDVA